MNHHSHEPAAPASGTAKPPAFDIGLHRVALAAPLQWLRLGRCDFRRAPVIGVFCGASFAAMGWMLLLLFRHAPAYTLALSAGFLLAGPFLCLGLIAAPVLGHASWRAYRATVVAEP